MSVADRFKSERERLALTQPRVADLTGVGKTTVINWEKGLSSPTAVQLSALAEVGLDVLYVITGQRAGGASAPPPPRAVSEGDRILLDNFHAAPAQVQAGVKTALGAFASAGGTRRGKQDKAA